MPGRYHLKEQGLFSIYVHDNNTYRAQAKN